MSSNGPPQDQPNGEGTSKWLGEGSAVFLALVAFGLLVIAGFSWHAWNGGILAFGSMAAGAALMVGALFGFVFGIPRSLQGDPSTLKDGQVQGQLYSANTNLEQISDWLTKILVGVGLTQLAQIPTLIRTLGEGLGPGLGDNTAARGFGIVLSLYFVVTGFLGGYLSTRIVLPGLFRLADLPSLIRASVQKEVQDQGSVDANAVTMIDRFLSGASAGPPDQSQLDAAVKSASPLAKVQIFQMARTTLKLALDAGDKARLERVIPVFKALIAADSADEFHRNHAQLAMALQEIVQPDWAQSELELSKAIQVRDRRKLRGWRTYEARRARARIQLQEDKELIQADLVTATKDPRGKQEIIKYQEITAWLTQNGLTLDDPIGTSTSPPPPTSTTGPVK